MTQTTKERYITPHVEMLQSTGRLSLLTNASPGAELSADFDGLNNDTSNALEGHSIGD